MKVLENLLLLTHETYGKSRKYDGDGHKQHWVKSPKIESTIMPLSYHMQAYPLENSIVAFAVTFIEDPELPVRMETWKYLVKFDPNSYSYDFPGFNFLSRVIWRYVGESDE